MGDGTGLIQLFSLSLILSTLKIATGKVLNASVHPSIPYYVYIMSIRETFLAIRILCLAGCEHLPCFSTNGVGNSSKAKTCE